MIKRYLICIGESDTYLTKYKKYKQYYNDANGNYYIVNDRGGAIRVPSENFLTLEEWRIYQLNKLNIK